MASQRYTNGMEITVAPERILVLPPKLTAGDAEKKAWEKKTASFDAVSLVKSFLTRPKDTEFELTYREARYQPFWCVTVSSRYTYERSAVYKVAPTGPEVKSVSYQGSSLPVEGTVFRLPVTEYCTQHEQETDFVDGLSGKSRPELERYVDMGPVVLRDAPIGKSVPDGSIVVPPQIRVSAIMRAALSRMIKGIQADRITEERIEVTTMDLYYRPVYAYKFLWKTNGKEAIVEIDGLTGEPGTGMRTFDEYLGKVIDQNFLFDLGADAAGLLVPGGSIAVKVVKRYIDTKR